MQILDSTGIVVKSNGVIYTRQMNKHLNDSYTLRLPAELKAKVAESAKSQNRSLNADIVARLEKSFEESTSQNQEIANNLSEMLNQTRDSLLATTELQAFYKQAVAGLQEKAVILEAEMSEMLKLKNRYQMAVEFLESNN